MDIKEVYFCLRATENEHSYIECDIIKPFCNNGGYELKYYRQLKEGHIPMYREVKIVGAKSWEVGRLLQDNSLDWYRNPHCMENS